MQDNAVTDLSDSLRFSAAILLVFLAPKLEVLLASFGIGP